MPLVFRKSKSWNSTEMLGNIFLHIGRILAGCIFFFKIKRSKDSSCIVNFVLPLYFMWIQYVSVLSFAKKPEHVLEEVWKKMETNHKSNFLLCGW
jgi:hypothetical protein